MAPSSPPQAACLETALPHVLAAWPAAPALLSQALLCRLAVLTAARSRIVPALRRNHQTDPSRFASGWIGSALSSHSCHRLPLDQRAFQLGDGIAAAAGRRRHFEL